SLPGVGAGVLLCFIPIVGEFVIPDLLAGSNSLMIGQTLWLEFFTNKDWPVASATAVVLLVLLLAPLLLYDRLQRRQLGVRCWHSAGSPRSTSPRSRWGSRSSICRS